MSRAIKIYIHIYNIYNIYIQYIPTVLVRREFALIATTIRKYRMSRMYQYQRIRANIDMCELYIQRMTRIFPRSLLIYPRGTYRQKRSFSLKARSITDHPQRRVGILNAISAACRSVRRSCEIHKQTIHQLM